MMQFSRNVKRWRGNFLYHVGVKIRLRSFSPWHAFSVCLEPVLSQTHHDEGSEWRIGDEVCVAGREQWRVHSQYPDFLLRHHVLSPRI